MRTNQEELGDLVDLVDPLVIEMKEDVRNDEPEESLRAQQDLRRLMARWLASLDGAAW